MAASGLKFSYSIGELVLCFEPDFSKARVLYEAKVMDSQVLRDNHDHRCPFYLVHFQGWNNSWDRLVSQSYLLKATDANRSLMKRLTEAVRSYRDLQRHHRIDVILQEAGIRQPDCNSATDDDSMDNCEHRLPTTTTTMPSSLSIGHQPVILDIPDNLKAVLEDDCISVGQNGESMFFLRCCHQLCHLPDKVPVVDILEHFVRSFCVGYVCEFNKKDGVVKDREKGHSDHSFDLLPDNLISLCQEMVDGVRIMFDFILPISLLYASEQEQYGSVMRDLKDGEQKDCEVVPRSRCSKRPRNRSSKAVTVVKSCASKKRRWPSVDLSQLNGVNDDSYAPVMRLRRRKDNASADLLSLREPRCRAVAETACSANTQACADAVVEAMPFTVSTAFDIISSSSRFSPSDTAAVPDSILSWRLLPAQCPPVVPSQVYGVRHLLRLLVKLPEILSSMRFEHHKLGILVKLCQQLLLHLSDHQKEYLR